jgi:hypothetical protein
VLHFYEKRKRKKRKRKTKRRERDWKKRRRVREIKWEGKVIHENIIPKFGGKNAGQKMR